jgi:hypothetical protein
MRTYLGRLKSVLTENTYTPPTDRTDRSPFVSSVSAAGTQFSEFCDREARPAAKPVPEWFEAIYPLLSRSCPDGVAPQRWTVLTGEVEHFAQQWAEKAMSLGWTFEELFALRDPFANASLQGAAWFIGDSTVTAVTADAITLRTQGGATQRAYRKSVPRDDVLEAAIALLEVELTDGAWHNSFKLEVKADAAGITLEDLARARHRLGVESRQWPGTPRKWRLPEGDAAHV